MAQTIYLDDIQTHGILYYFKLVYRVHHAVRL